jgi:membrane-associated phospholipid phosphatase
MVFRPLISEGDVFCELVAYVYRLDKPYNAFPSIHSLTSFIYFLAGYGVRKSNPAIAYLIQGLALAIIASTLLIKQHVILDVMGGVILGGIIYLLAAKEMRISHAFYKLIKT